MAAREDRCDVRAVFSTDGPYWLPGGAGNSAADGSRDNFLRVETAGKANVWTWQAHADSGNRESDRSWLA